MSLVFTVDDVEPLAANGISVVDISNTTANQKTTFQCDVCQRSYESRKARDKHVRARHGGAAPTPAPRVGGKKRKRENHDDVPPSLSEASLQPKPTLSDKVKAVANEWLPASFRMNASASTTLPTPLLVKTTEPPLTLSSSSGSSSTSCSQKELETTRDRVVALFGSDPDGLDRQSKVNAEFIARVESMSYESLRSLLRMHDAQLNTMLSSTFVDKSIGILSSFIGKVAGCEDELLQNSKNPLLVKHVSHSIGTEMLDAVTAPLKSALLYGSIVVDSVMQSKRRKLLESVQKSSPVINNIEVVSTSSTTTTCPPPPSQFPSPPPLQ